MSNEEIKIQNFKSKYVEKLISDKLLMPSQGYSIPSPNQPYDLFEDLIDIVSKKLLVNVFIKLYNIEKYKSEYKPNSIFVYGDVASLDGNLYTSNVEKLLNKNIVDESKIGYIEDIHLNTLNNYSTCKHGIVKVLESIIKNKERKITFNHLSDHECEISYYNRGKKESIYIRDNESKISDAIFSSLGELSGKVDNGIYYIVIMDEEFIVVTSNKKDIICSLDIVRSEPTSVIAELSEFMQELDNVTSSINLISSKNISLLHESAISLSGSLNAKGNTLTISDTNVMPCGSIAESILESDVPNLFITDKYDYVILKNISPDMISDLIMRNISRTNTNFIIINMFENSVRQVEYIQNIMKSNYSLFIDKFLQSSHIEEFSLPCEYCSKALKISSYKNYEKVSKNIEIDISGDDEVIESNPLGCGYCGKGVTNKKVILDKLVNTNEVVDLLKGGFEYYNIDKNLKADKWKSIHEIAMKEVLMKRLCFKSYLRNAGYPNKIL
jgi:hypothetical protein